MGDDKDNGTGKKVLKHTLNTAGSVAEGGFRNAKNFSIRVPSGGANVVNIIDKTVKNAKGKPTWWVRYDGPHRGANYNHININPTISGVPDPHTAISAAQLSVSIRFFF